MFTRAFTFLSMFTLFLTTAACGGGGGSSGSSPPPPPPTGTLPITSANAQNVTSDVLQAVDSVIELLDLANVVDLPGVPLPSQSQSLFEASQSPFAKLDRVDTRLQQVSGTLPCDSGEFTATFNDADNDMQVSTGDSFDIQFAACFFATENVTLNGAASVTNITITGDPENDMAPWSVMATFGFDNLEGMDATDSVVIDGDLTLGLSTDDSIVVDVSITTTSLTVMQSGETETLSDFVLTEVADLNTMTITIDSNGTFTSTELNGAVTFETLMSFEVVGDNNPSAGQVLISDGNSSVLATVIDNISVRLEIDEDLDGTIDDTIIVTWDDLDID